MFVLVTGPDNSGKSTLISRLKTDKGFEQVARFRRIPPLSEDGEDYFKWGIDAITTGCFKNIISDRGIIDEFVYGPILRGRMVFENEAQINQTRLMLSSFHVKIVICQPPIENQVKGFNDRWQLDGTEERMKQINNWFDYIFSVWPFQETQHFKYDYTEFDAYERLISFLDRRSLKDEH